MIDDTSRDLRRRVTAVTRAPVQSRPTGERPTKTVHIHIGEHFVSDVAGLEIVTVLGSCVGACIRDSRLGIGGMNHFMLPDHAGHTTTGPGGLMRYGSYAMERLINDLLAAGARRDRLEVKLFGGANTLNTGMRIGDRNVEFVRTYLANEGMVIESQDLGGNAGRRIHYEPVTGKVMRLLVPPQRDLITREQNFARKLKAEALDGSVELF